MDRTAAVRIERRRFIKVLPAEIAAVQFGMGIPECQIHGVKMSVGDDRVFGEPVPVDSVRAAERMAVS